MFFSFLFKMFLWWNGCLDMLMFLKVCWHTTLSVSFFSQNSHVPCRRWSFKETLWLVFPLDTWDNFQWSYWLYRICKINEHYLQSYQLHLSLEALESMIFTNLNLHYVIRGFHVNMGFYGQVVLVETIFKWPHPIFALLWLSPLWTWPAPILPQTYLHLPKDDSYQVWLNWRRTFPFIWTNLNPPKGWFVSSLVKASIVVLEEKN